MNLYNNKNVTNILLDEYKIIDNKNLNINYSITIDNNSYEGFKLVEFKNKYYIVSKKAILTINITGQCNAKCNFCYNSLTFKPNSEYLNHDSEIIKDIIDFCNKAKINILSISGGEPALFPKKLLKMIELISGNFRYIRIHTNGVNLKNKIVFNGKTNNLYKHLADLGVSDLSISIAHYDFDLNKTIMKFNGNYQGLKDKDIKTINSVIPIRLSCFLLKEGISSPSEAIKYYLWGRSVNVKKYVFRNAALIPKELTVDNDTAEYNKENRIKQGKYVKAFIRKGFRISYSHLKSDSYLYILNHDDICIDFSSSGEELDKDYKIRRLILMQDGKLYTSWVDKFSVLEF